MAENIPADLTPLALQRLYTSTLRKAKAASDDVSDCLQALLDKGDPLKNGSETGQQYSILKAEAKRAQELSLESVSIANALHLATMGDLTAARAALTEHKEAMRLAAEGSVQTALGSSKSAQALPPIKEG